MSTQPQAYKSSSSIAMIGLTNEEQEFIKTAITKYAESEQIKYSEDQPIAYKAWWRSMQERAKRIGALATKLL